MCCEGGMRAPRMAVAVDGRLQQVTVKVGDVSATPLSAMGANMAEREAARGRRVNVLGSIEISIEVGGLELEMSSVEHT